MLRLQDASAAAPLHSATWTAVASLLPEDPCQQRTAVDSVAGHPHTQPPLHQGACAGPRSSGSSASPHPELAASHSDSGSKAGWEQCLPLWAADLGTYALTTLHAIYAHTPQLRSRSHLVVHFVGASVGEVCPEHCC